MLRPFTVVALAAIGLLLMTPRVGAGLVLPPRLGSPAWQQVVAKGGSGVVPGDDVYATAFHGYVDGNTTIKGEDVVLRLLNSGTKAGDDLRLMPGSTPFTISSTGMFSTDKKGPGIVDVVEFQGSFGDGFKTPLRDWVSLGKTELSKTGGPFGTIGDGTLTLASNLAMGSYVLSLKSTSQFSVYLFANVGEISEFKYILSQDLSHATLYRLGPGGVGPQGNLPEPTSLAVFGIGALLGVGGSLRRHFENRKGLALRGLAT